MELRVIAAALAAFSVFGLHAGTAGGQTLEDALAQAYLTNPELMAERAALRATDEGVPTALSGWRPTVSITGSAGKNFTSTRVDGRGGASDSYNTPISAGLIVSQPIYTGGRTDAEVTAAESRVMAGRANLIDVEQSVLVTATTTYMDVVRDQSVLDLNINNEQVLARQLEATRDRFEVGEVTRTDVSQAEARLSDAQASRIETEGNLQVSRADYRAVVGGLPGMLAFPTLDSRPPLPQTLAATLALALDRNPAILGAVFSERAALYDISAAGAALLPQITLEGELRRSWDPNTFFDRADSASIEAQVSVPLYQSGSEYARIRELRQVAQQRRSQLDLARRNVAADAARTWEVLQTARARIRSLQASVEANDVALEGVRQEAAVGARTVLDVLDAEQEAFSAKVNLVSAQRDEMVAAYQLLTVIGALNVPTLGLPVEQYDPTQYYFQVRDSWWGFGPDYLGSGLRPAGADPFDIDLDPFGLFE